MSIISKNFEDPSNRQLRKQLAAFFTKKSASTLLSLLLIKSPKSIIIDPACGSGTLLKSAYERILTLKDNSEKKSFLIGFEICYHSWKEAFEFERFKNTEIDITILHGDAFFLLDKFNDLITQNTNVDKYTTEPFEFIILANPPFSKSQNLPLEYKKKIVNVLKVNKFVSLGLHYYFLTFINNILPNKGKYGIILPISISFTNRGVELIQSFFVNSKIKYIIISDAETAFSIDSNFQEVIIIGTKNENESTQNLLHKVTIINLKVELKEKDASKIADLLTNLTKKDKNSFFTHYTIAQKELVDKIGIEGWNFLYRSENLNLLVKNLSHSLITISSEKRIKKKRGINVPADFFFIPNKYYNIAFVSDNEVSINLKKKYRQKFDKKFETIILPKRNLLPLIRKPEFYKTNAIIEKNDRSENYCLVLHKNSPYDPEIEKYLLFGKKINAHKRSNTSILRDKWFLASQTNLTNGNLFLTFKWDPRYRSFLMNYSISFNNIASQAFWVFNIDNQNEDLYHFFLSWFNSTLNMAIIHGLADIQRRVWRQLSGNRIDSLLIVPFNYHAHLSTKDKKTIKEFNHKEVNLCLLDELSHALRSIESNNHETHERIQVDLLFLKLLRINTKVGHLKLLKELYSELKNELHKIANY